jgi:AcrR family transcriptional regulator
VKTATDANEHPKSSRRGRRPEGVREITRGQILDAAEWLFLENGFAGATVQAIASEAGYTTGAIYRTFRGKADLFLAVYHRRWRKQQDTWRVALTSETAKDAATTMGAALTAATYEPEWYAAVFEFFSYASRNDELRRETAEFISNPTTSSWTSCAALRSSTRVCWSGSRRPSSASCVGLPGQQWSVATQTMKRSSRTQSGFSSELTANRRRTKRSFLNEQGPGGVRRTGSSSVMARLGGGWCGSRGGFRMGCGSG